MVGRVRLKDNGFLDESLPTLQEITCEYILKNIHLICRTKPSGGLELHENLVLPWEICDSLLETYQNKNRNVDDSFIEIFQNTNNTPLKFVHLRNSTITNDGFRLLFKHDLIALSLWYCENITVDLRGILKGLDSLKSLELGLNVNLLKFLEPNERSPVDFKIEFPNLRKLVLNGVSLHHRVEFNNLKYLTYLDLTSCTVSNFNLESLLGLPQLTTLILFNVWPIANQFPIICKMKQLQALDLSSISNTNFGYGTYDLPDLTLAMLIDHLPNLTHLDISGTNLAGTGVAQKEAKIKQSVTDISGLAARANRPLQFLGLYNTANWACKRHDIPAIEIAGDANEEQILTAAKYYHDRPVVLTRVLNDLYHIFRYETCRNIHIALDVVLKAMDQHVKHKNMQISGSATLFYIVKGKEKAKFGTPLKNHIIRTLLNGMQMHISDDTMLRNGYLTLCQFSMPGDVLFEYERLITILLHGVSKIEDEGFVQRIAIYLLNTLACQVDGKQKLFLGDLGVIDTMLNLIRDRLNRRVFDDVMEVAWSTMWNVTDETAVNCSRFLDGRGMEYFLQCLQTYPDKEELLRNMMGLLGNVAEVKHLRPRLMTKEFIKVFYDLLLSESDGIEVSYNAAGVLAHIASDGIEAWTIESPTRQEILVRMVEVIERWNLDSQRNINYRSFEPILGLVRCYETPECQHWAVWALANLTKVYPEKYCRVVEQENGLEILSQLIAHKSPYQRTKDLAKMVISCCYTYKTEGMNLEG